MRELSANKLSALSSNFQRGCGVQYLAREVELFGRIVDYFRDKAVAPDYEGIVMLLAMVNSDLASYHVVKGFTMLMSDKGSLRILTWSEKATTIMKSVLERYMENQTFLEHTGMYVCDICGFIYIMDNPPVRLPGVQGLGAHDPQSERGWSECPE